MLDFIKNNIVLVVVAVLAIVIIGYFLLRKTTDKTGAKSSFKIFKKRLDESEKPAVATTILNTEEINNFWNSLGNDLCGKPFNMEKLNTLLQSSDESDLKKQLGLEDLRVSVKIRDVLIIAIFKSNIPEDKKIDYIATIFLDMLLTTSGVKEVEYNKEKGEVKLLFNVFEKVNLRPSAEIISIQEFGNLCFNAMAIYLNPEVLKESLSKKDMPQASKDDAIATSKKVFDAITVEKVCALLS